MRFSFTLLLLLCCGCASEEFRVTLIRAGEVSGITERYTVNQNALGTKTVTLPSDSEPKPTTYTIDSKLVADLRGLLTDSLATIAALNVHDTGALTTGLQIDKRDIHKTITWVSVDPPELPTPVLDSLYHLMLHVESEMAIPK